VNHEKGTNFLWFGGSWEQVRHTFENQHIRGHLWLSTAHFRGSETIRK
jgi:hypothetical protein